MSKKAWEWAVINDNVPFVNPPDVVTGEYGNDEFSDDFYWAAAELYLAIKDNKNLAHLKTNIQPYIYQLINSWKFFVRNNGSQSLIENKDLLDEWPHP